MTDFFLRHLGSIGLILDIIGVSILFFVVLKLGEQVILADKAEEELRVHKKRQKENILRTGYGLIFIGFTMQLCSNEMNIAAAKKAKEEILNSNEATPGTPIKFDSPNNYSPLTFLRAVTKAGNADTPLNAITMVGDFPDNWVKSSDIDTLTNKRKFRHRWLCD